ncbi:hypothetical protein [Ktedonospora formicarum]|uniref:HAMP domain-containing protein n=1 Tax=Ktedonospora formicarum TaxID=2778364 RepID=A0A8J3HVK1_9CHLR|nr:hypothetical protein [Ktedonospora formicarum]GHO42781.1 hypothetical protein KSX_09440 [Ktedonospora formicarum]
MRSNSLRLELLVASMLPVTAICIVGAVGLGQMEHTNINIFLLVLVVSALAVFFAEIALINMTQRATKNQFIHLIATCREYTAGNREKRAPILGDNALTTLAQSLNVLLDQVTHNVQHATTNNKAVYDVQHMDQQIQKLITEIKPIMDGDLRVRANVPAGNIGLVADICNALIEELANLAKWTRYSSEQVMSKTQTLLANSVELAQTAEAQMSRFSDTTETVEKMVAFIQRLSSTLHLNVEIVTEIRRHLPAQTGQLNGFASAPGSATQLSRLIDQLHVDTRRQEQLLNELLDSAQSNATLAESMISELYAVAQRIYQSSTSILQTVEHIHSLAKLAQQWNNSIAGFQLPEDSLDDYGAQEREYREAVAPLESGIGRRSTDLL